MKRRNGDDLLNSKASRAIQYIYEQLKSKNPRLQGNIFFSRIALLIWIIYEFVLTLHTIIHSLGQKAVEDKEHVIDVTSPDDKVLNCCLQLQNQSMDIILVTNDKNLSNKALLNGIEAITSRGCLERF